MPARIRSNFAEEPHPASARAATSTPYEWWVSCEAGEGRRSRRRSHDAKRVAGDQCGMRVAIPSEPSHLSSALSPHDALDAKVWYHLLLSASMLAQANEMCAAHSSWQAHDLSTARTGWTAGPQSVPSRMSGKNRDEFPDFDNLRLEQVLGGFVCGACTVGKSLRVMASLMRGQRIER